MRRFESNLINAIRSLVKLSALTLCIATLSFPTQSDTFVEGTHYLLDKSRSASTSREIVEYFSFSCPGCYALEPAIVELLKSRPNSEFRRVHAPFGGRNAKTSQKAFVLMKLLDGEEHSDAIFQRIHKQKNYFDNDDEIIEFFVVLGFSRSIIKQILNSFSADVMTRTMNKKTIKSNVTTVPSLIVNGVYAVNLSQVRSVSELAELIEHLDSLLE